MTPRERLGAWRTELGMTRQALAGILGCDGSFLGHIEHGRRLPGRKLANAIEEHSKSWPLGPIRSTEWDALEESDCRGSETKPAA